MGQIPKSAGMRDMKDVKIVLLKSGDPTVFPPVCSDTMKSIRDAVGEIAAIYRADAVFTYEEREAASQEGRHIVTINGKRLEELVPIPDPSKYCGMACAGCGGSGRTSEESDRDVVEGPHCAGIYRIIPESVLRLAVKKERFNN